MFTELFLASAAVATYRGIEYYYNKNKWKTNAVKKDIQTFNKVCNFHEEDFLLIDGEETKYGTKFIVSMKNKEFSKLKDFQEQLQAYYSCPVEIELNDNFCTSTINIIKNTIDDNYKYEPVKLKPTELYFGLDNHFQPIIADLKNSPNVLIAGSTGKGKTQEMKIVISNLITSNTERDINFHYVNINLSNDFKEFIDCKQTKSYVENIDDGIKTLEHLNHIIEKRLTIFKSNNVADAVEYNKKFYGKRVPTILLCLDELADYMPVTKLDPDYEKKVVFYEKLGHIIRKGRKCSIFTLACLQRSDNDSMKATIKANFNIRVGFGLPNNASSLVICDNNDCVDLPKRTFLYCNNGERLWAKSIYIDDDMIREYVKPSVLKDRQKKDDFNVFLKIAAQKQSDNTAPSKDEIKETKSKAKAKAVKKAKVVELEVATTESKEPKSRIKNVSCEEIDGYEVVNGQICTKIKRRVE